jgi:VIT1/CCC1 family predicted Fe2+/Mn2+ transporter
MRMFAVAADVAMGAILAAFIYAALSRTWPALQHPLIAAIVLVAAVGAVLCRRPGGSLASWWQRRAGR